MNFISHLLLNCTSILYAWSSFGGRNVSHHFPPFWRTMISGLRIHNLTVNFHRAVFSKLYIHPSAIISCYDEHKLVCNMNYISTSTFLNSTFTFNNILLKALKDAQCLWTTDFTILKSLSTPCPSEASAHLISSSRVSHSTPYNGYHLPFSGMQVFLQFIPLIASV